MKTHFNRFTFTLLTLVLLACIVPSATFADASSSRVYVTGAASLGTVAEDLVHLGSYGTGYRRPDTAIVATSLTFHNLPGGISVTTSYRQPLFGESFWNHVAEKFTTDVRVPLWKNATGFVYYERNPASGMEWGWVGVTVPFRFQL